MWSGQVCCHHVLPDGRIACGLVGEPTRLVAGRYATIRELGRGGMGVVWLAEDQVIGRRVALKELRTTETERVLSEVRTAGRLNSPNVVAIHDVIADGGATYIVMELVEAPTLTDLMARRTFSEDEVAGIALQTLSALEAAHAAGIVHRDVKPSNIMVASDGTVKLADFGIARAMDDPGLTATGGIMGSPGYMAPELFAGQRPSPASDLWALGATVFHAIEGHSPFQRDTTAATMHAIMYEEPVIRRARGPLADVITGLLHQHPDRRLTAAQTRALLGSPSERTVVIEPVTTYVTPQPTREAFEEPRKRRTGLIASAAVAGVAVIALVTFLVVRPGDQSATLVAQQNPRRPRRPQRRRHRPAQRRAAAARRRPRRRRARPGPPRRSPSRTRPRSHRRSGRRRRSAAGTTAGSTSRPRTASPSRRSSTRWTVRPAGSPRARSRAPASSTPARSAMPATT